MPAVIAHYNVTEFTAAKSIIHVLNHSLATMDSGSSRGGGKVFLIPKFNSMLSQQALEVSFYAVL